MSGDRERLIKTLFRAYLAPVDGVSSKATLAKVAEKAANFLKDKPETAAKAQEVLEKVWAAVSANLTHANPDSITEQEFVTSWIATTAGRTSITEKEDWLLLLFKVVVGVMDSDGDGTISLQEFTAAKQAFSGWSSDKAASYFGKMDSDGNGVLDKDEVIAAVNYMFFGTDASKAYFCPPQEYGV